MPKRPKGMDPADYLIETSIRLESGCWIPIQAPQPKGYVSVGIPGRKRALAHRLTWERLRGPIPDGQHLDHLCRNTSCCNPEHLDPVSMAENNRRQGAAITHCRHGHEYTPENTWRSKQGHRLCRECRLIQFRNRRK